MQPAGMKVHPQGVVSHAPVYPQAQPTTPAQIQNYSAMVDAKSFAQLQVCEPIGINRSLSAAQAGIPVQMTMGGMGVGAE
eukprot:CAMPEP_0174916336 /NCGR_PEP_ID=MMETSP1355-20121228/1757_1 /TAXON_ID=464990 /ORGANISM="Hemiselmis tepida, Strain CCMP443" /LENGTH=79 /DNA_ID=CAMNT_0016161335 /DNA_START=99 /DNA_END=335 /DNA_ORIENTATION=+